METVILSLGYFSVIWPNKYILYKQLCNLIMLKSIIFYHTAYEW